VNILTNFGINLIPTKTANNVTRYGRAPSATAIKSVVVVDTESINACVGIWSWVIEYCNYYNPIKGKIKFLKKEYKRYKNNMALIINKPTKIF